MKTETANPRGVSPRPIRNSKICRLHSPKARVSDVSTLFSLSFLPTSESGETSPPASISPPKCRPRFARRTSLVGQLTRGGLGKPFFRRNSREYRFVPPRTPFSSDAAHSQCPSSSRSFSLCTFSFIRPLPAPICRCKYLKCPILPLNARYPFVFKARINAIASPGQPGNLESQKEVL